METPTSWMLVTNAGAAGVAIPFSARIGEGTLGNAVRRLEVQQGNADLRHSAERATQLANDILHREEYLNRQVVVSYEAYASWVNVHGRSAELAFAFAFVDAIISSMGDRDWNVSVAATGMLGDDGAILPVEKLPEKIAAALNIQPRVKMIFFPAGNAGDLPVKMELQAYAQGTDLFPSFRLEEALRHYGLAISHSWLESPFRGLEPFEFKHASIFFGRDTEIEEILALLRRRAEQGPAAILVQGPSGSGKSSLVLAGVIPALLRRGVPVQPINQIRWGVLRRRSVKADIDPIRELDSLAAALRASWCHGEEGGLSLGPGDDAPADALDPGGFLAWLGAHAAPERTRYVWVLDQMEEWLQGPLQPATTRRLCAFLAGLAQRGVWLIATLTNAAHPLLREHAELAAAFGVEGQYPLAPQHSAGSLEAVIREPARAAGLRYEPGLDTEIFAASSHGGVDVLPLLELLLTELYERRDPSRNELRFEDYRAVGGLDGVISARAEAVFTNASGAEQAAISQLLWKLATAGEIQPAEYQADHPLRALVAAFQQRRLLVEDRNLHGHASLRAAHEALFRHWPRAVEQRRRDETDIRLWLDLDRESGQWARGERALIPAGPQLAAAFSLLKRRAADWTASDTPVINYVCASLHQRNRRRTIAAIALGVPAVIVGGFGIRAGYGYLENQHLTIIKFDDIPVPGPDYAVAAGPYLRRYGISISARSPADSDVLIKSNIGLYEGQAANPEASEHFLTQEVSGQAAPISFTLKFSQPVKSVSLMRAALWPATSSGVSHPAWNARAFDDGGKGIAAVSEPLLAEHRDIPAKTYVLIGAGGSLIRSVRITSDYRDANGLPFAGFHAVLINEIELVH